MKSRRFDVAGLCELLGCSAEELAAKLGVHERSVYRWLAQDADPSPMALTQLRALKKQHDDDRTSSRQTEPDTNPHTPVRHSFLPSMRSTP